MRRNKKGWVQHFFSPLERKSHAKLTGSQKDKKGINPWDVEHILDYEKIWNELELPGSNKAARVDGIEKRSRKVWPSDEWWTTKGSWHLAVDGKGLETCWESFQSKTPLHFSRIA